MRDNKRFQKIEGFLKIHWFKREFISSSFLVLLCQIGKSKNFLPRINANFADKADKICQNQSKNQRLSALIRGEFLI